MHSFAGQPGNQFVICQKKIWWSVIWLLFVITQYMCIHCVECKCNGHAESCHFDKTAWLRSGQRSGGVCDCLHNTSGRHCQHCKSGFYRDPERPWTAPDSCRRKTRSCIAHNGCVNKHSNAWSTWAHLYNSHLNYDKAAANVWNVPYTWSYFLVCVCVYLCLGLRWKPLISDFEKLLKMACGVSVISLPYTSVPDLHLSSAFAWKCVWVFEYLFTCTAWPRWCQNSGTHQISEHVRCCSTHTRAHIEGMFGIECCSCSEC